MKECISIKSDYQILSSLIKISDLVNMTKNLEYSTLGIIDDNMSSSIEFINLCLLNNIKPIVGLDVLFNGEHLYLYAKNEIGLKKLFKLNTYLLDNELDILTLTKYINDIIIILP